MKRRYKQVLSPPRFPQASSTWITSGDDDLKDNDDLEQFIDDAPEIVHKMMREEERFGKWIGLFLAIIFWLVLVVCIGPCSKG